MATEKTTEQYALEMAIVDARDRGIRVGRDGTCRRRSAYSLIRELCVYGWAESRIGEDTAAVIEDPATGEIVAAVLVLRGDGGNARLVAAPVGTLAA